MASAAARGSVVVGANMYLCIPSSVFGSSNSYSHETSRNQKQTTIYIYRDDYICILYVATVYTWIRFRDAVSGNLIPFEDAYVDFM